MDREKFRIILDIFVVVMMFVVALIMLAFLFTTLTEGGSCVLNPLAYWENQNNKTICEDVFKACMPRL